MFGNEHESSPLLSLNHYFKIVVYDGYVKYEEAEIHRSAIMQDFRDSEKKNWIFWSEICHWLSLWRHYIMFYIHGPVILHFLSSVNITKFKTAAKCVHFWNKLQCFAQMISNMYSFDPDIAQSILTRLTPN